MSFESGVQSSELTDKIGALPVLRSLLIFFLLTAFAAKSSYAETLTLSEGLKIATERNRIIKIASYSQDIASADILYARSRLLPSVTASVSRTFFSRQPGAHFGSQSVYTSERDFLSYGVNASQTLFDFGADLSRYKAAKTSLEVSKLDMAKTKNLVALDFVASYLDLLEIEKMISVAQKEVESLASHLQLAKNLFDQGVITKNDLLQAEVRLSDAQQKLLTMKNLRAIGAAKINNLLSRQLKAGIQVSDAAVNSPGIGEVEKAWEISEKERQELKIIDQELSILDLQETVKKSEYYPKIFVQGGYNYAQNRYQLHEENWSLVLGAGLNIYSGGSTKAEISKVRYRKEQLVEQRNKLAEDIKLEVSRYYLDMQNASEKIRVAKDAVSQAEENLRINKIRYEEGIGTSTEVLDAITLLTTAETNYYRAAYELRRAEAGLMYATGQDLVGIYK